MQINTIFKVGSPEMDTYLKKNPIGNAIVSSDGSKTWTIKDIEFRKDLPPDPIMGKVVMVTLILASPDDVIVQPPDIQH